MLISDIRVAARFACAFGQAISLYSHEQRHGCWPGCRCRLMLIAGWQQINCDERRHCGRQWHCRCSASAGTFAGAKCKQAVQLPGWHREAHQLKMTQAVAQQPTCCASVVCKRGCKRGLVQIDGNRSGAAVRICSLPVACSPRQRAISKDAPALAGWCRVCVFRTTVANLRRHHLMTEITKKHR